jgi:hypothetical protein
MPSNNKRKPAYFYMSYPALFDTSSTEIALGTHA